jgi:hypothetical membrane protein
MFGLNTKIEQPVNTADNVPKIVRLIVSLVMIYLIIAAAIVLTVSIIVLARLNPDYSHVRHTISELGARGFVNEKWVAYGAFAPYGLAMAVVAYVLRANEPILFLAGGLAIGYIGAAIFPIDAGAPWPGTTSNVMHGLCGAAEYIGAIAAFEMAGRDLGFPFTAAKFLIFGFLAATYIPGIREYRGLLQRIVEVLQVVGLGYFVLAL